MNNKIGVGLIGYGYASQTFHAPLIAGTAGMELRMICSSNTDKVRADWPAMKVTEQVERLFHSPELDLIVIPTPNDTHYSLATAALAAGKHVVVDKPFTVTLSQAIQLKALAEKQNCLLSVFHNRRWDSDFLTLLALLQEGVLGEITYFASSVDRFRPQIRQRWREMKGEGSGLWYDLAPHLIDQTLQLFGLPEKIQLDLAEIRPQAETNDYFHAVLTYPKRRVILHSSMLAAAASPRYQVHGTQGSYVKYGMDPQEAALKSGHFPPRPGWGTDDNDGQLTLQKGDEITQRLYPSKSGDYPAYYQAIGDAINGLGVNPVTAEEAIQVMKMIELGRLSAEKQQTLLV